MISITVTSSQEQDRQSIAAILSTQKDFCIASLGEDGYDALRAAKTQQPDIIIMDFCMDDTCCTDIAPIIRRYSPATALIVLCTNNELSTVEKALRAGISGYLLKQKGFDQLPSSIRCVYLGGIYLCRSIRSKVLHSWSWPASKPGLVPRYGIIGKMFSLTELRIFFSIALGYTDDEIAHKLNMHIKTLRNCIARVKEKTGLRNRTQIALFILSIAMMDSGNVPRHLAELEG